MTQSDPKVKFGDTKMTYSDPKVTYSGPKMTYSEPKVTHSDPTHLPLPLPTSHEPEEAISEVKLNFGWRRWWVLVVVDDNQI